MIGRNSLPQHHRINRIVYKKTNESSEAYGELLSQLFICENNRLQVEQSNNRANRAMQGVKFPHEEYPIQSHA